MTFYCLFIYLFIYEREREREREIYKKILPLNVLSLTEELPFLFELGNVLVEVRSIRGQSQHPKRHIFIQRTFFITFPVHQGV